MKIARKLGKIVVRLSKIGRKMAKIVYLYIFVCTFQLRRLFKLSPIALRMSKIGCKLVKIVFLYEHLSHEDWDYICDDCELVIEDWLRIGQDCINLSFLYVNIRMRRLGIKRCRL